MTKIEIERALARDGIDLDRHNEWLSLMSPVHREQMWHLLAVAYQAYQADQTMRMRDLIADLLRAQSATKH